MRPTFTWEAYPPSRLFQQYVRIRAASKMARATSLAGDSSLSNLRRCARSFLVGYNLALHRNEEKKDPRTEPIVPSETLTITDDRTGKTYKIPISDGTIRAMDLRQTNTGPDDFGMKR